MKWIEHRYLTEEEYRNGLPWITRVMVPCGHYLPYTPAGDTRSADLGSLIDKTEKPCTLVDIPVLTSKAGSFPVYFSDSAFPDRVEKAEAIAAEKTPEEKLVEQAVQGQGFFAYSYSPDGYKAPAPPEGISQNRLSLAENYGFTYKPVVDEKTVVEEKDFFTEKKSEDQTSAISVQDTREVKSFVSDKNSDADELETACDDEEAKFEEESSFNIDDDIPGRIEDEPVSSAPIKAVPVSVEKAVKADTKAAAGETAKVFCDIPINEDYIIPAEYLLVTPKTDRSSWEAEIIKNSELLVKTLYDFSIESRVSCVNRGPVVTLYEMTLAPGIKVTRIVSLADDIAMALAAARVRVVAPIPGKSAIGIEVPNSNREMVTLGDIINTPEYRAQDMMLKIAMGKDILGKPVMIDLKKQPHLLIAGATGAGKSVCVNGVITSLVYNYDPNYLRFILIDPKMVELQLYNGLPHLLTPVITDPDECPKALKWAIYEMERRYRLLSEQCVRDIDRYNHKIDSMKHPEEFERLPYIVIIIDEFADLMMVAPKEVESYITRIAQKARAVGIHLVLATQRPSVDIITGIIKANFPARVAFQVAQKTDSRTIIDQNGAEKLLGKGDMLYQSPTSSFPVRIQSAYIAEDEIMQIVARACKYARPRYIDFDELIKQNSASEDESGDIQDEMFLLALKIVEETKKASASYLQRRLSIGYNRAARIIERMEELGYIGPQIGSKPREVYV